MCKAFSCIVLKNKKAVWKFAVDSHDKLLEIAEIKDDTKDPKLIKFCRVEISPKNKDYLNPDAKYQFKIDMDFTPEWWTDDHEKSAWRAFQKWKKQLDKILVQKPIIHPFHIKPPAKITEDHIRLLKEWDSFRDSVCDSVCDSVWASVRDSVWDSVWFSVWASGWDSFRDSVCDSVCDSVWASVRDSVWFSVWASGWDSFRDSVRDSVWASVRDSVWAYTGTFFILPREAWKYTEDIKTDEYPFQCLADLWEQGLVPSFDGKKWRLHGGKDAKILWEGVLK
jgi:hypothetical protein